MTLRKWPSYDPATDGSMFEWIHKASAAARTPDQRARRQDLEHSRMMDRTRAYIDDPGNQVLYSASGYSILDPMPLPSYLTNGTASSSDANGGMQKLHPIAAPDQSATATDGGVKAPTGLASATTM